MDTDIDELAALDQEQLAALLDLLLGGLIFSVYYVGYELSGAARPLAVAAPPPAETYDVVSLAGAGAGHEGCLHYRSVSW